MEINISIEHIVGSVLSNLSKRENSRKRYNEFQLFQYNKFSYTKDLIHQNTPREFNDVYIPLIATHKKYSTNFNNPAVVFSEYPKILLTAGAGAGKTTLLRHILLRSLAREYKYPVYLELREFPKGSSLRSYIITHIFKNSAHEHEHAFEENLNNGDFIFILDGFEEMHAHTRLAFLNSLEDFTLKYSKNSLIISSRSGSELEFNQLFTTFYIADLDLSDIASFIRKSDFSEEKKYTLTKFISDPQNNNIFQLVRNPLFLTIYISIYSFHASIPRSKAVFFNNIFEVLYSSHDAISKRNFIRERVSNLSKETVEEILSNLAFVTYFKNKYEFTEGEFISYLDTILSKREIKADSKKIIYDLVVTISMISKEGLFYSFYHLSIQEYFAALYISRLSINSKHTLYNQLFENFFQSSENVSYNFWDMCLELDEKSFVQLFIIPKLQTALTLLKNLNTSVKVFFYYEPHDKFDLRIKASIYLKLFEYLDIMPIRELTEFLNNNKIASVFNIEELLSTLRVKGYVNELELKIENKLSQFELKINRINTDFDYFDLL